MADFASFALQVATVWGCKEQVETIFQKLGQAQADLVLGDNPIAEVLDIWLRTKSNHGRRVEAGTLEHEWRQVAQALEMVWPFQDGKGLAGALKQILPALNQRFEARAIPNRHRKQFWYCFWPKPQELHQAPFAPVPIGEPAGVAGIAG